MRRAAFAVAALWASAALAVPSGHRWRTLPAPYRVFTHPSINGVPSFQADALPVVRNGFARWTSAQVSCTTWNSSYLGNFTSPTGKAIINATDQKNHVVWLGGADWAFDSQTLGLTTTTWYVDTNEIIDADMQLNDNREWKVGGALPRVDVESIVTHEAGHFLGLDHTANPATVMYATYPVGELKATLHAVDISDVCGVYPKTPGTGTQGAFCSVPADCAASAPVCRAGPTAPSSKICTMDCAGGQACPSGFTCQTDSLGGKACLATVHQSDVCKFCTTGGQCQSGLCVGDGRHNWCANTCQTPQSAAQSCGAGFTCVLMDGTATYVCKPTTGVCPQPQCTTAAQCPVGYDCVTGMCEATGRVGDRCEVSTYCSACTDCIGTLNEAYCRACCDGLNAGGTCTSCANMACPGGFSCLPETNMKDSVCVPSSGAATCQTCSTAAPCQRGLTCFNGRCLKSCNLNQPGTCEACFPTTAGGLCACADATSQVGQVCRAPPSDGGTYSVCVNGAVCLGTPNTCRVPCVNAGQCDTGQTCKTVDGQAVCVPDLIPGAKCNACGDGGTCNPGLVCFNARCYTPCDAFSPTCSSCVDVSGPQDVCACDDQRAAPGEACGEQGVDVYACSTGSLCIDRTCRLACVQGTEVCAPGETCREVAGTSVCAPTTVVLDGGHVGPAPKPDGGQEVPGTNGCGCGASGLTGALPLLLLGLLWRGRRSVCPR